MPDFTPSTPQALFSARRLATVTPSDTTDLTGARAVWVGGAGTLTVKCLDDSAAVSLVVPAGTLLPLFVSRVMAATTATSIVVLY
jgi:hypothetical protein